MSSGPDLQSYFASGSTINNRHPASVASPTARGDAVIEAFKNIRFRQATLAQVDKANETIGEYRALGFILTLRQLFYQFVSRGAVANTTSSARRTSHVGAASRSPRCTLRANASLLN